MDRFVNSTFYRNKETLGSIFKQLRDILKERKAARRTECLLALIDLLGYCDKHAVLEETRFNPEHVMAWGKDQLPRKFFCEWRTSMEERVSWCLSR